MMEGAIVVLLGCKLEGGVQKALGKELLSIGLGAEMYDF